MAHNKFPATLVRVYDGDTVYLNVDVWPDITIFAKLRLNGIDTPELRTRSACEKNMAIAAKAYLHTYLQGKTLYVTDIFHGKYAGRVVGELFADGVNVSMLMLKLGYAKVYTGGKRDRNWCVDL